MIDLDEEQARMEAMLAHRERMALGVTCTEMIELITSLRQAEKDAARYRWLRDCGCFEGNANDFFYMDPRDTDSAIDEAIQCNK